MEINFINVLYNKTLSFTEKSKKLSKIISQNSIYLV